MNRNVSGNDPIPLGRGGALTCVALYIWCTLASAACALASEPIPELKLFQVSAPSLRTHSAPRPAQTASVDPLAGDLSVSTASSRETPIESSIQHFEAMNGESFLKAPVFHAEPGGAYGFLKTKVFDPITTPEVIKLRKVQLTGGVVGAIKKKNPFYLLNPLVFAVDW